VHEWVTLLTAPFGHITKEHYFQTDSILLVNFQPFCLQLRNNYDADVYNGDLGCVIASPDKELTVGL
jgi:ATP-dependent exoDNAse (exonuclease V) alpha subunit